MLCILIMKNRTIVEVHNNKLEEYLYKSGDRSK